MNSVVGRTAAAVRVVPTRLDARLVFVGTTLAYLLVYLFTIGDITLLSRGEFSVLVVDDLSRAFTSLGFGRFEAIAQLRLGPLSLLISPLNLLIAFVLSGLVGLNLALTYLGWVQPKACGLESSTGVLGAVPALLSGAACCGPTILLVFGIQASGVLITGFQFLIPVAILMLLGSLLLIGRQVNPAML